MATHDADTPWAAKQREKLERLVGKQAAKAAPPPTESLTKKKKKKKKTTG